jgi:hypothetical protein
MWSGKPKLSALDDKKSEEQSGYDNISLPMQEMPYVLQKTYGGVI